MEGVGVRVVGPVTPDEGPINAAEMRVMLEYVQAALEAGDQAGRNAVLAEGIVKWGEQFVRIVAWLGRQSGDAEIEAGARAVAPLGEASQHLFLEWLAGKRLSDRADEAERRAQAAVAFVAQVPQLARLSVLALAQLPERHPLRATEMERQLAGLRQETERARNQGDLERYLDQARTLLDFVADDESGDELLADGLAMADRLSLEQSREFRLSAAGFLGTRALRARDAGDLTRQRDAIARARRAAGLLLEQDELDSLTIAALLDELEGDFAAANVLLKRLLSRQLPEARRQSVLESLLRTYRGLEDPAGILRHAKELVPMLETSYVTEVDDDHALELGYQLSRTLSSVAWAYARTGDLARLLITVERGKSLRLRYRAAIRRGGNARRIQRLEAALWRASRGAPPEPGDERLAGGAGRLGRGLSLTTRLAETYRGTREVTRPETELPDPGLISKRLRRNEGVVVLGAYAWGTVLLLMRRMTALEGHVLFEQPDRGWKDAVFGENESGWVYALGAPWEYTDDPRPGLNRLLEHADRVVGVPVAAWVEQHNLSKLTVVPHALLHLVPWWAVPSLAGLDVRTAPSLTLLPRARAAAALRGEALVVSDPTGDLPISRVEAARVAEHLRGTGVRVVSLTAGDASEEELVKVLHGTGIVHFCGHGVSDRFVGARSALHVAPAPALAGEVGAALLDRLAHEAERTHAMERPGNGQSLQAQVPLSLPGGETTGLLTEERLSGGVTIRRLEHGPTGTLFALYLNGRIVRLAELLEAGDVGVSGTIRSLRLAVLSACESGGVPLALPDHPDEFAGLPAVLLHAGVRTVICTGWKVNDALSALAVDMLWSRIVAARATTFDVAALVSSVRRALATMPRDEAANRVRSMRASAPTPRSRFALEAYATALQAGPERPFEHPYDWGAFFVVGEPLLTWRD
jgi:hypothetical protein